MLEPTAALAIGAILAQPAMFREKRVCCVISGANVDPEAYIKILGK
jgi:threonine dehydratase